VHLFCIYSEFRPASTYYISDDSDSRWYAIPFLLIMISTKFKTLLWLGKCIHYWFISFLEVACNEIAPDLSMGTGNTLVNCILSQFKNATNRICKEVFSRKITWLSWRHRFRNVFKTVFVYTKMKTRRFQIEITLVLVRFQQPLCLQCRCIKLRPFHWLKVIPARSKFSVVLEIISLFQVSW